jgi:hypothetical protein
MLVPPTPDIGRWSTTGNPKVVANCESMEHSTAPVSTNAKTCRILGTGVLDAASIAGVKVASNPISTWSVGPINPRERAPLCPGPFGKPALVRGIYGALGFAVRYVTKAGNTTSPTTTCRVTYGPARSFATAISAAPSRRNLIPPKRLVRMGSLLKRSHAHNPCSIPPQSCCRWHHSLRSTERPQTRGTHRRYRPENFK